MSGLCADCRTSEAELLALRAELATVKEQLEIAVKALGAHVEPRAGIPNHYLHLCITRDALAAITAVKKP